MNSQRLNLCVIPGDGIGQEVIPPVASLLQELLPGLDLHPAEAGWETFTRTGTAVPKKTLEVLRRSGAALFGAVSSPSGPVAGYRSAIVTLRRHFDLYANLRPVRSQPIAGLRQDVDLILFRENSEGLYAGRERLEAGGETAIAERVITRQASQRLAQRGFDFARREGRRRVTIIHKANVLPLTDGLFRTVCQEVGRDFSEIKIDDMLVDVAAYWLLRDPARFDVILTTNMFGDILSDAAAHWGGGLGLVPSLNWGDKMAIAEPVHGSAPDIAGRGVANPAAALLSAALLLRHVWDQGEVANQLEAAVAAVILDGVTTPDLGGTHSTNDVIKAVRDRLAA